MGIGKTLRGGVVDASDQVMGFVVAKVPLKIVLRWRTHRRKGERKVKQKKKEEEKVKKSNNVFFVFFKVQGQNYLLGRNW